MMHHEEVVVTLVDDAKKPIREYDSIRQEKGRKCKIFIPFDTEYKILVKNNNDRRISLEIDIDGTIVSGNGLIIGAHQTDYIERFVNMAKKFKFVRAGNEAVADPTNKENGLIKIRVAKEKKVNPFVIHKVVEHHYEPFYPWYRPYPYNQHVTYSYSGMNNNINSVLRSANFNPGDNIGAVPCSYSADNASAPVGDNANFTKTLVPEQHVFYANQVGASMPVGEAGATVEGSKSDQTFTTTTWNGDDEISWFTFHVSGVDIKADPDYQKFLELKKKFEA